jgi:hypothetical protein
MDNTTRNHSSRSLRRSLAHGTLVLGIASVSVLLAVPVVAQAAARSVSSIRGQHTAVIHETARTSSICDKVSAATVSGIIGYKVPAGTATTFAVKPTKANFGISGTNTICTYGSASSMAALLKDVSLSYEVISKPLTSAEIQESLAKASKNVKIKFSPYSGLGVPGFYFSLTEAGITGQGISGIVGGTHYFGASVESKSVSKSTLAALAKLAEKL